MQTVVLPPTPADIARAAQALRRGELVAMPTETVYGLAGNALDASAVAAIFAAKERPTFDPLIVHVPAPRDPVLELQRLGLIDASQLDARAARHLTTLAKAYWPGPLTLVLPRGHAVPELVTSGLPTVAVRSPGHPVAQALLAAAGAPLAAPSANRFGRISPTTAAHVRAELDGRIPWILDGGAASIGVESTVLSLTGDQVQMLRPGSIGREELEARLGEPVVTADGRAAIAAPGMLERHYAPAKLFVRLPSEVDALDAAALATLTERAAATTGPIAMLRPLGEPGEAARHLAARLGRPVIGFTLSRAGDPAEAARQLFATLRELDASEASLLLTEPVPPGDGLLHALADRLRRATTAL